jgi:hypothetical protein
MPPLKNLAMKILFCRAFGLISAFERQILDGIRSLRNRCGHSHKPEIIDLRVLNPLPERLRECGMGSMLDDHGLTDEADIRKYQFAICVTFLESSFNLRMDVPKSLKEVLSQLPRS